MPTTPPLEPLPRVVRGSLVVQRRRCGRPNCHCADGVHLHESSALSYSEGGRNRTLMLAAEDIATVRRALDRYRLAKGKLEEQADAGIAALSRRAAARRSR